MDIVLNTGDLEAAANQLKNKASEMESAIHAADSSISPLRSFKSPRIARDVEAWDSIKTAFEKTLQNLLESADELVKAAQENASVNQ